MEIFDNIEGLEDRGNGSVCYNSMSFSSNILQKIDKTINTGYIYLNLYKNSCDDSIIEKHEELKKIIISLEYEDRKTVEFYELCEIKNKKVELSILIPYYRYHIAYCHEKEEIIEYLTAYHKANDWLELAKDLSIKYNVDVLCRSTKKRDTLKINGNSEKCIGYISNSEDFKNYLFKEGVEYLGLSYACSYFSAMGMAHKGYILISGGNHGKN